MDSGLLTLNLDLFLPHRASFLFWTSKWTVLCYVQVWDVTMMWKWIWLSLVQSLYCPHPRQQLRKLGFAGKCFNLKRQIVRISGTTEGKWRRGFQLGRSDLGSSLLFSRAGLELEGTKVPKSIRSPAPKISLLSVGWCVTVLYKEKRLLFSNQG